MKVELRSEVECFKPIELKVTIESLEDLANLYQRMNISDTTLKENESRYVKHKSANNLPFFDVLEELSKIHGLYNINNK